MFTNKQRLEDFEAIGIKLASPEVIEGWSQGEVQKPETINYRTQRPEKGGLFDERIFGPEKDYECYCGKYRGVRYKGIICEKCGVELTRSLVRRERMGHIDLAAPVAHIWFLRNIPSKISLLMGLTAKEVERVVYFAGYIITKVDQKEKERLLREMETEYKAKVKGASNKTEKESIKEVYQDSKSDLNDVVEGKVLDEITYHKYSMKYGSAFEADIGAEAIYKIFRNLDINQLEKTLEERLQTSGSAESEKINKRLSLVRSMIRANVRPEWMFLTHIPVIPPALRPMVPLEGGRHATSDINDLYRRVINRNNRLKRLKDIMAPDVILRNEKRILQEAVDALIDNSSQQSAMSQAQRRPLKSLTDYIKGKQGYFRRNLLGKRVDYSGRSVIVVGPDLKLNECGLPKQMALELFRPFVISKLLEQEIAYNIRGANHLIDEGIPEVWSALEEATKERFVLLNRAPTLHRQGIQAFQPKLIEGSAIQLHPLVCPAFNADFDGDQMAVHLPLSDEAQLEAREFMTSEANVLKPGSGEVILSVNKLDVILGCYWMTKVKEGAKGEEKYFESPNRAIMAYDFGNLDIRANIKVMATDNPKYAQFEGGVFETSVGRLLFNSVLPSDYPYINEEVNKKRMAKIIDDLIDKFGISEIPSISDKIKKFGFKYSTVSGITWGIDELKVPEEKVEIIREAKEKSKEVETQYEEGLLYEDERKSKNIAIWHAAKEKIEKILSASLDKDSSSFDMWQSGARGSLSQIVQMAGMKGLIQSTSGETIEHPVIPSMKEGLTPIEYFVTTHGSRKGLADTALQTSKAGYLTRRLFDVSQDVIIEEDDCGTKEGVVISTKSASGIEIPLERKVSGRALSEDVKTEKGNVLFKKGHVLTASEAREIEESGITEVSVRSPMTCKSGRGICRKCYGWDLATNDLIDLGETVGTVAAQAIGEPGTQLTMRTFHTGGAATVGGDITQGLPRVEEIFEKRMPRNPAAISKVSGVVSSVEDTGDEKIIKILPDVATDNKRKESEHKAHFLRVVTVKEGDKVKKGDFLTDGSANINDVFKYGGREKAQNYIIDEISKIYELQGASISRKHIEVVIKQMFSRSKVKHGGDTKFTKGEIVENMYLKRENRRVKEKNGEHAKVESLVLGISDVALTRRSFLSASSFQNTTKILINSAVKGRVDKLHGLKENVIIGRLIPAGSGFEGSQKQQKIEGLRVELDKIEREQEIEREREREKESEKNGEEK